MNVTIVKTITIEACVDIDTEDEQVAMDEAISMCENGDVDFDSDIHEDIEYFVE